jgi:competence protein ComEA
MSEATSQRNLTRARQDPVIKQAIIDRRILLVPSLNRRLLLPLLLGLAVVACGGGGSSSTPTTAPETTAAPIGTASSPPATASAATPASSAGGTVNANNASVEELQAAFAAAGISNADRWAREVAEYRPYESDPTWARLRQELGKYNIDPAVLEQIIAILTV